MPLQLSLVGKMPLQKSKLEICHSNFLIPLTMPFSLIPDHISTLYCHTYAYTSARTRKKKVHTYESYLTQVAGRDQNSPIELARPQETCAAAAAGVGQVRRRSWVGRGRCWRSSPWAGGTEGGRRVWTHARLEEGAIPAVAPELDSAPSL